MDIKEIINIIFDAILKLIKKIFMDEGWDGDETEPTEAPV